MDPEKSRIGKRSSKKGATFERWTAKELSLWLSGGNADDWFVRSRGSGAASWVKRQRTGKEIANQAGDISANSAEAMPFSKNVCIECKHYKNLALYQFFGGTAKRPLLLSVFLAAARKTEKKLWLVVKENHASPLIMLAGTVLHSPVGIVGKYDSEGDYLEYTIQPLESFLKAVHPSQFR